MIDPRKTEILSSELDKSSSLDSEQEKSLYVEVELGSTLASRYKVESKLGEGGMGVVYAGEDLQLNRPVAIKLLKRNVSQDSRAVEKLKQEAQVSMMLTHSCIMRLINFEQDGDYAFLLMDYVDGMDLSTMAERRPEKKLDEKTVAQIAYMVCSALDYAHKKNIIHRDIKPANIMISVNKEVKLMDFGIARVLAEATGDHPQLAGTLAYIAPEVFAGEKPDNRCDLYALGLTMYELLAGDIPFKGRTASEIINHHLNTIPPKLEGVSREFSNIIFQLIEKKPNARFQSAQSLRVALGKYLGLDESDKVSKMKKRVDHDRRKLDSDRRKIERKLDQLETDRREMQRRIDDAKSTAYKTGVDVVVDAFSLKDALGEIPLKLLGVAIVSGLVAEWTGQLVNSGDIMEFESVGTYGLVSSGLSGLIILGIPAVFRSGANGGWIGAVMGVVLGIAGFYMAGVFNDFFLDNEIWLSYSLVDYFCMGLFLSFGAAATLIKTKDPAFVVRLAMMSVAAVVVTSLLPYAGVAESVMGFDTDSADYFYLPLASAVIWGTLDFGVSWLDK